ncbi:MAG: hypothetical protein AMXMBFR58_29630 [Phycisphaerae bacterium]
MLNRTAQLGLKIEGTEGVEETLAASDYSGERKSTSNRFSTSRYARATERPSLSKRPEIAGARTKNIRWEEELVGGGAATAAPWHTTIRGMGFASTGLKVIDLGTVTNGPFKVGQIIGNHATFGSATKTGRVAKYVAGTPGKLYYMPITGTFADSDTVYNYASSQGSAPVDSTPANAGYAFNPMTETAAATPPSVTVERRLGGLRHTIIGARGTGGLTLRHNEPALINADFQGCPVFDTDGVSPRTGAVVTSVPDVGAAPRVTKGISVIVRTSGGDFLGTLTMVGINFNNSLAPRPTINSNDCASSGYKPVRITDREPTAEIDPEMVLPADGYDIIEYINSGATVELIAELGAVTDTNGCIVIWAGAAQHRGDLEPGDRDGITTSPATLLLTGGNDDELFIFHIFG